MQSTDEIIATNNKFEIQKAIAASDMCKLLTILLNLPTKELADGILNGSFMDDVVEIFRELGVADSRIETIKIQLGVLQEEILDNALFFSAMRQEYTRLFTHPKQPVIAIYETLFRFKPETKNQYKPVLFISPAALDARRCYKEAGFVSSNKANESDDHMAIEMEYMSYLYLQKAKALSEGNQEKAKKQDLQLKGFIEVHLQKWGGEFFDSCIASSESEEYKVLGRIGNVFLSTIL